MRVAIALWSLDAGGAEFQMALLAGGLQARGHTVEFWLMSASRQEAWAQRWCRPVVRTVRGRWGRFAYLQIVRQWRQWIGAFQPHVLIGGLPLPHALVHGASMGTDIPVVGRRCAAWGDLAVYPAYAHMPQKLRALRRWSSRRTRFVVCNAQHVLGGARDLEGWPASRLVLIRNGWPEYPAVSHERWEVATAARHRIEKGTEDFRRVVKGLPSVQSRSQDIHQHFEADVPWNTMGVYAHVSRSEGCSNSIGMAMAHALPVVAYGIPGNLELLRGLPTVWPFEEDLFTKDIEVLQSDRRLRQEHGLAGQELVRKRFGLDRMVTEWETLLRSLGPPPCPTCGKFP